MHNDQTFREPYWQQPVCARTHADSRARRTSAALQRRSPAHLHALQPVPPARAIWHGPYTFPRLNENYGRKRPHASIEEMQHDPGGGEGVIKLLKARSKAAESWGYEWIHTVLILKGRSLPTLPASIIMVWSFIITIAFMAGARFDRVLREDYGVVDVPVQRWQRDLFIYMRGLEVRLGAVAAAPVQARRGRHADLRRCALRRSSLAPLSGLCSCPASQHVSCSGWRFGRVYGATNHICDLDRKTPSPLRAPPAGCASASFPWHRFALCT